MTRPPPTPEERANELLVEHHRNGGGLGRLQREIAAALQGAILDERERTIQDAARALCARCKRGNVAMRPPDGMWTHTDDAGEVHLCRADPVLSLPADRLAPAREGEG